MGPSLRLRIQKKTEYAVEAHWLTPSEESKEDAISREDNGFNILG
jgi:hypothetical protein